MPKGQTGRHLVKYPVAEMQSEEMGNNKKKKPERNCGTAKLRAKGCSAKWINPTPS